MLFIYVESLHLSFLTQFAKYFFFLNDKLYNIAYIHYMNKAGLDYDDDEFQCRYFLL